MAAFLIDFEWWRDPKGYRFLTPKPGANAKVLPRFAVASSIDPDGRACEYSPRIARLGEDLVSYRPLDHFEALCTLFANTVHTAHGLLEFVQKFGPLTNEGLGDSRRGERVDKLLEHAESMRSFLSYACGSKDLLVEMLQLVHAGWPLGTKLELRLALDPATRKPRLRLAPAQLIDALWVQLGQVLSGGSAIRQCDYCGKWFDAGPGTGRRLDAKFCSKEHTVTFHSLKRSRGTNDA